MAIVDEDSLRQIGIDSEWHEQLPTISLLQKVALERKELRKRIRSIQEKKASRSHSDSACDYWIRGLKKRGILNECNMDCTPMTGQVKLGESGGVAECSPEPSVVPQSHSVSGSPVPSEVSSDCRPPR